MAFALIGCFGTPACVDVNGGAVELSWSLRTFAGDSLGGCERAGIETIRLCWQPLGDGGTGAAGGRCRPPNLRAFPCNEESGITRFEIPPGRTSLWIEPVCADGLPADPDTYEVPPPIVRTIEEGQVATLSSLLVAVAEGNTCPPAGCTCQR